MEPRREASKLRDAVTGQLIMLAMLLLVDGVFYIVPIAHPTTSSVFLAGYLAVGGAVVALGYCFAVRAERRALSQAHREGRPEAQGRRDALLAFMAAGALIPFGGFLTVSGAGWAWGLLLYAFTLPYWLHVYLQWRRCHRPEGAH